MVIVTGSVPLTASRSPVCGFASVIVADKSVELSASVMEVSTSAIGTGAPFSVNAFRKLLSDEPLELSASRSSTGALLFTTSTWIKACAVLLLPAPSLTTMSMTRVSIDGVVPVLSNLICCSAV